LELNFNFFSAYKNWIVLLLYGEDKMTSLVIVESPAKCKKIQGFLGPGWQVIATMGHIRALEEDIQAIGIDKDFEPSYRFLQEKAKAIASLRAAAKNANTVYLASDDDREGEAISYSVALLLGLNPQTTPRSVFHEITAKAVRSAVENPRRIDMNRVNAQQARSMLDLMVGFTISPLLWNYVGPGLSAGRCQTPALRLICEREQEIQTFSSTTVWKLKGQWQKAPFVFEATLKDELEDEESALNFLENIHSDSGGTILQAVTKQWSEGAPKPLITSTLQQEASALFSSNPKKTMSIAQKLYEAGHITYMRTDHPILSEEAIGEAQEMVKKLCGETYIQKVEAPKKKKKDESGTKGPEAQEAHEAIRPTHFDLQELPSNEDWDSLDTRIYKLIWNRAVQSVMASTKGDERVMTFVADGDPGEFPWEAKWRRTTFAGWKKIGTALAQLDETEAQAEADAAQAVWIQAVSLKEGDKIKWSSLEAAPQISKAAPRYNEATLVRDLEKKGIGRPSTYASLVSTLFEKKYSEKKDKPAQQIQLKQYKIPSVGAWPPKAELVTKSVGAEKDKMIPTALGLSCLQFCLKEFPTLFAYDFTSHMETRLDKVAQGQEFWKNLCRDTWNSYKDHLQELKHKKGGSTQSGPNPKVREFGDGLKAVLGKKGPILLREDPSGAKEKTVFYGWPEGKGFHDLTDQDAKAFLSAKQQPTSSNWGTFDGNPIVEKKGPFGAYFECAGVRVPMGPGETPESLHQKFQQKLSANQHSLGSFEFRQGPYGMYMFKKAAGGKKPAFVGLPEGLDPKTLTLEAAERIYKNGLEQKKAAPPARGGYRGRGGRGGRGRGGGPVSH
jgi:DNA topoisomerase-1